MLHPLEDRLIRLGDNRTLGAVDLALEALDIAAEWIACGHATGELATTLQTMHSAIATVRNVAREIGSSSGDPLRRIGQLRASLRDGNRIIAEKLAELIPANSLVVTLSNSSTVRDALTAIGARGVYVMESRPGGEGAQMAQALRCGLRGKTGHEFVTLIPDDAIERYVLQVDCALVGVDSFDASGAIWHKIGTLPLARLCRRYGKPFYAAGHSLKRSDMELVEMPPRDPKSGEQIFDRTPVGLITALVSEVG